MEFITQPQPSNTMQIPLSTKSISSITKPPDSSEEWILIFDTETTDLPQNGWDDFEPYNTVEKWKDGNFKFTKTTMIRDAVTNAPVLDQYGKPKYNYICKTVLATDTLLYPHIIQFSYILFNRKTNETKIINKIIHLDEEVYLSPISEAIHNISMKKSREKDNNGYFINPTINQVLCEFMEDFYKADIIVAHNLRFDRNVILAELCRHRSKNPIYEEYINDFYHNKKEFCTCDFGTDICKIVAVSKVGKMYHKMPKLKDLYKQLFDIEVDDSILHNAFVDVVACLVCFYKIRYNKNILNIKNLSDMIRKCICNINGVEYIHIAEESTLVNKKQQLRRSPRLHKS